MTSHAKHHTRHQRGLRLLNLRLADFFEVFLVGVFAALLEAGLAADFFADDFLVSAGFLLPADFTDFFFGAADLAGGSAAFSGLDFLDSFFAGGASLAAADFDLDFFVVT